jgi:hypothetical protein
MENNKIYFKLNRNNYERIDFNINGLKVINVNDYVDAYPDLEFNSPKDFRSYIISKKGYLPKMETSVTYYNAWFDGTALRVNSPLVIKEDYTLTNDSNKGVVSNVVLNFNLISTLYASNYTKSYITYSPLLLTYNIKPKKVSLADVSKFVSAFVDDPLGTTGAFVVSNWFLLFIVICLLIVGSLVYANFNGGKPDVININNRR